MPLIDSRRQRLTLLCALYSAQGVPRGFMTITLMSYLAARGVSDAALGTLSAAIALPWAGKVVWALMIDTVQFPAYGKRRPWLVLSELGMAITLVALLARFEPTVHLALLGFVLMAHNWFASLQDVASDGLAIDIVPAGELGLANGWMMAAKVAGKGVAAAGLAYVMARFGFHAAAAGQIAYVAGIMLLPVLLIERQGDRRFPWSRPPSGNVRRTFYVSSPRATLRDVLRAFGARTIVALSLLGCTAAVGEWLVEVINNPFYTQHLGWSYVEFSALSGAFLVVQVGAGVAGAWTSTVFGWRRTIIAGLGMWGLLAICFAQAAMSVPPWFATAFLLLAPALNVFGSVGFYAVAMQAAWTRSAVTVFTIMMAITSFGHVIGGWLIGPLRERVGLSYAGVYSLAGVLMLASLVLLFAVNPAETERKKLLDEAAVVATA